MNVLEIQSALTKLDDNALKQEMLSPGVAPQFLVLSEMQRRQEIRNGGKAPPAGPRPSMKDEALGIGSLPQGQGMAPPMQPQGPPPDMPTAPPGGMPPGMQPGMQPAAPQPSPEPAQGFAAGGAVRFAGGGPVVVNGQIYYPEDYDQDPNGALRAYQPRPDWTFGATPPRAASRRAPTGTPTAAGDLSMQGLGSDGVRTAIPVQALADDVVPPPRVGGMPFTGETSSNTAPAVAGLPAIAASRGDPLPLLPRYPATRTASVLESGLGANTDHAGATIRGPLGISNGMWSDYAGRLGLKPEDRENPEAQRRIYETFSEDQRKLNPRASDADVYTAWAAGPAAARGFRANPNGDAYTTYQAAAGGNQGQADAAFSTNPGLLRRGASNSETLSNYRSRWDGAAENDMAGARVAPSGSGAAAVGGDSARPIVVTGRDSTGGNAQGGSYRDAYRDAASMAPDRLAGLEEESARLFGRDAGEARSQAGAFALMEAGLRMAGSKERTLAAGIGEGGLAGLQSYRAGMAEARKTEREGLSSRIGLASARAQQDQGIAKVAGDIYGTETRLQAAREGYRSQEGIARLGSDTSIRTTGMQGDVARGNAQLGAQTQITLGELQAQVQRETRERQDAVQRYVADNPANWTTIRNILAMPEGPGKEQAWRSITSPGYGAAGANTARAQYFQAYQQIEDNYKPDPLGRPEIERQKADALRARIARLNAAYPEIAGEAGAPTGGSSTNPLGLVRPR